MGRGGHILNNATILESHIRQGTEGGFSQQETEDFSPATHKELNLANNHVNVEADPYPVEFSDEASTLDDALTPCERL